MLAMNDVIQVLADTTNTGTSIWTILQTLVGVIALFALVLAVLSLRASHSSNYMSAWSMIIDRMMKDDVRGGRAILRFFANQERKAANRTPHADWHRTTDLLLEKYTRGEWVKKLKNAATDADKQALLKKYAIAAYDEMDVAAGLILHSRIPDLLHAFVFHFQDSIRACWEQGECFFEDRVREWRDDDGGPGRAELYVCFSVAYETALAWPKVCPKLWPYARVEDRAMLWSSSQLSRQRVAELAFQRRQDLVTNCP